MPATILWIMLSSQSLKRSSRGCWTVARDLHHVVDIAAQREAETVDCRFRLLGSVGWRDAADAGVGWWGGLEEHRHFLVAREQLDPENQSALRFIILGSGPGLGDPFVYNCRSLAVLY